MEKVLAALKYAMDMEKTGQKFYQNNMDKIKGERAKAIFKNLAVMEEEHYNFLKRQYEAIASEKPLESMEEDELLEHNLFTKRQSEEGIEDREELSNLSILRMAYLIEHDFANFYRNAKDFIEDEACRKMFDTLAKWEEHHEKILYQEYSALMRENWFDMGFEPF
jgi:rubrerythrin